MKQIDAAIAVVVRDGKVLLCQRKANDTFGGYWEFPGGKREHGESLVQALTRELREELAVLVEPIHSFEPIRHDYKSAVVTLHPFLCNLTEGEPQLIECQATVWVEPTEMRKYTFPPANESLIESIIEHLSREKSNNIS